MEEPTPQNWRRFTRLRPDRKRIRRHARKIESATVKHAHTFIVRRWDNIKDVRRVAFGWVVLVGVLIGISGLQMLVYRQSFTTVAAVEGGTYAEGVTGPLETINPLFATSSAEKSASRLIFSGLLGYDAESKLRGEIAKSWRVEDGGRRYVVDLKQNVSWHDGAPVTADDVVYTVSLMKNSRTRSPLYSSWVGISAKKLSQYSVQFELPMAYAPFPHALTFGLVPKHLLNDIRPESLREAAFNRAPIGSGAFIFNRLQLIDPDQDRVVLYLTANKKFVRGTPKLERFQLHVYKNAERIKAAFITNEINAAADLTSADMAEIKNTYPDATRADAILYDGVYALFRTDSPTLQDVKVREALRLATDRSKVIDRVDHNGEQLHGPLLSEHYLSLARKRQPNTDLTAAGSLLDQAGWTLQNGKRVKDGQELKLTVVASRIGDYPAVVEEVVSQWKKLGVVLQTQLVQPDTVQQNVLMPRAYDVLIYELAIGADPDVYAYWHSSQAGPRGLNLSNYKSTIADDALISAQSRVESNLRQPKYEAFVDTWIKDVPAVALYKPYIHYITTESTNSIAPNSTLIDSENRYKNVEYWTVDRASVYKTP